MYEKSHIGQFKLFCHALSVGVAALQNNRATQNGFSLVQRVAMTYLYDNGNTLYLLEGQIYVAISRLDFTPEQILAMKANFAEQVGYTPSPGQASVHTSNKRFRIVMAGSRFGKSMAAGFEGAFYATVFPDFRVWIVGPKYDLARREFKWCLNFIGRYKMPDGRRLSDIVHIYNPNKGQQSIQFPWDSFIETKTTEELEQLKGEACDMVILSEASHIPRRAWEECLRERLGDRHGLLLAPSTGSGDTNLFADFVANGLKGTAEFADWQTWQYTTLDNPTFDRQEYYQAQKELDPTVFSEQYEGKLVTRRGLVFRFQNAHILEKLPEQLEYMPIIVSIQPGYKNPCAVVFLTYDPNTKEYIIYDELMFQETLMEEIIPKIRAKWQGRRFLGIYSDYWQKDDLDEMKKCGLTVITNDEEKKIGRQQSIIIRVRTLQNVLHIPDGGKPRFRIYQKCTNTIESFKKCKWPDRPKEEADKLESEMPLEKYFQFPQAIAHVLTNLESASGVDIYEIQRKR